VLQAAHAHAAGHEQEIAPASDSPAASQAKRRPRSSLASRAIPQMCHSKSSRIFIDFSRVTAS